MQQKGTIIMDDTKKQDPKRAEEISAVKPFRLVQQKNIDTCTTELRRQNVLLIDQSLWLVSLFLKLDCKKRGWTLKPFF